MSTPTAEGQTIASFVDSASNTNDTPANTESQPTGGEQPGNGNTAVANQDTGTASQPQFVGFKPEQPNGQASTDGPADGAGKWTLQVAPDAVIAHDHEGKPITAAEVQSGYFRNADYTKKTQELAAERDNLNPVIASGQDGAEVRLTDWWGQNFPVVAALNSDDVNVRAATLRQLAEDLGVDLGSTGPSRGPDGRFTSTSKQSSVDLEALKDEFGEDSHEYQLAVRNEALASQVAALENQVNQFTSGLQTHQQQQQTSAALSTIAQEWQSGGFKADVQGALELVGQPITAEQAMLLHNHKALMQHNITVAQSMASREVPNEVSGSGMRPGDPSAAGKSVEQYMREKGLA